jgi:hypothetical protein
LIRPTLDHAVAFNRSERRADEWFDEPDELDRVQRALDSIAGLDDVVDAAAVLVYRFARAQGFGEGNKRTACCWLAGCSTAMVRTVCASCRPTTGSSPTCLSLPRAAGMSSVS